jgi:small subunit ribosomal protein S7
MRKNRAEKRLILPDSKYNDLLVAKFTNMIMYDGKKGLAQKIIYNSFDIISKKISKNPLEVFKKAIENASPLLELKVRRVAGSNYQVPVEVAPDRKITLALR